MRHIDLPGWLPPVALALFGLLAAAGIAYLTSQNRHAGPGHVAVWVRMLIIVTLTAVAVYAQASMFQRRMAMLLAAACVVTSAWLLNGSGDRLAFTIGVLFTAPALVAAYYLMLAHPSGTLHSRRELRFITIVGTAGIVLWTVALLATKQPPLRTPLLSCIPHCPANELHLGIDQGLPVLPFAIRALWTVLTVGSVVLIDRRWRMSSGPLRRSLGPVRVVAFLSALALLGFFVTRGVGADAAANVFGTAVVAIWVAIPLAILAGLASERLFMGQALARFVTALAKDQSADPRVLMAETLQDPSLSIAYARPATGGFVDFSGGEIEPPDDTHAREVAWIRRGGRRIAALSYDRELADQRRFIQAGADAAVMRLEQAQLLADLRASNADLAASRLRLVESAQAERKRIERDLHDSVQQDLLGLRLKLDLAAEAIAGDPAQSERIISAVGNRLDEVLDSLRDLARGIHPPLLLERGPVEAVRSAARRAPIPVSVHGAGIGRLHEDVEIASYYCCLEAIQNAAKHAGTGAQARVRFWQDRTGALCFEVSDDGAGFAADAARPGTGLANMRDRIEAVGGTVRISSAPGKGTAVRGRVPSG